MRVLSTAEQRAVALPVLLRAAKLYRARAGTLQECIGKAADDFSAFEYAKRVVRGVIWDLDIAGWEADRMRRRADVWRALKTAIKWCSRRPGGWRVTGQQRSVAANMPPGRQWLEYVSGRAR